MSVAPICVGDEAGAGVARGEAVGACLPPSWASPDGPDFVQGLIDGSEGREFGEVAAALKDRLLADPSFAEAEIPLLEDVAGVAWGAAWSPAHEDRLRALCGLWLMTPDFLLSGNPTTGRAGRSAPGTPGYRARCEALDATLEGLSIGCGDGSLN